MKRYMDLPRMNRLRRTAKILSFGGLGILVVALLLSLGSANNLGITLGLALLGLLTSQMGSILTRRWPDRGRADQVFDAALKGLDSRNALFHYLLGGCRHALLAPNEALALVPVYEPGIFDASRGSLFRTKTKRGEPRGNPGEARHLLAEADHEAAALSRELKKRFPEASPEAHAVLVFFHPEARVNAGSTDASVVHVKKLKEFIRAMPRRSALPTDALADLEAAFDRLRYDD